MDNHSSKYIEANGSGIKASIINVPYSGEIPPTLVAGRAISIVGIVKPKATRLSINLNVGAGPSANIAFHLNPRFDQNYVVRNSRIDKDWGVEEITAFQKNLFKREETFYLCILVTEDNFMVSVNGKHFCAFKYRLSVKLVNTLEIHGDVVVTAIKHRHIDEYPEACPVNSLALKDIDLLTNSKEPINTPFFGKLQNSFNVGKVIEVLGRVKILPHSFYINFQSGPLFWPHPEIPLHLNPRFVASGGSSLVCNSWLYNKWNAEVSTMVNYFRPGRKFSLKIKCEKDEYVIAGDDTILARFKHQINPEISTVLLIHGDVEIYSVVEK